MIVDNVVLRPPRLPLVLERTQKSPSHCCASGTAMRWWSVFSPIPMKLSESEGGEVMQERGYHTRHWLDIGMSARTLAKSVMMMQRRSKQIRSAEAKQKRSGVSIGGEMARGSRGCTRSLLLHIFCSARKSIGKLSGRRASAMRLCARRVSGAAHREQRCGLVVMDGCGAPGGRLFAFWAGAAHNVRISR